MTTWNGAYESALNRHLDTVFPTDSNTFRCRQAVMDDTMTVIRSRKVVLSGLYCPCSLIKGPVPYGMQFYLKTETVSLPTEVNYLLIRIVKHSPTPFRVAVLFMERRSVGTEATVKSTLEAASNPGYLREVATEVSID